MARSKATRAASGCCRPSSAKPRLACASGSAGELDHAQQQHAGFVEAAAVQQQYGGLEVPTPRVARLGGRLGVGLVHRRECRDAEPAGQHQRR
ncbi:hypothetical protein FSC37_00880 [Piscinibacter aquaticus]|uniref:Uncharacterized protein n=1 Tax=Piscinibacter aquaticus TaxID=392597 RepID=A0A5C6U088_9BURK|nr:hypothetical protein FSC37_00880 [Piscinibacter aquaticus]